MLKYTNARGRSIVMGQSHASPFWLETVDGLNKMDASISTYRNVGDDGVCVSAEEYEPRTISLRGTITNDSGAGEMIEVLGVKGLGVLEIGGRGIECRVQNLDQPKDLTRRQWSLGFIVSLFCPYPFFFSMEETEQRIVSWDPSWRFPFTLPQDRTFIFGSRAESGRAELVNVGQVACPVTMIIRFNGTVVNPQISVLETGETMRFNGTFNVGDVIDVDTYQGRKDVRLNGTTDFNVLDTASAFFRIPQGESTVEYRADLGALSIEVSVRYRAHYLGGIA